MNRTPFCQAIVSNLYWHNVVPADDEVSDDDDAQKGPLQSILKHSPEALYTRDEETGLYPFMLAATISTPTSLSTSEGRDNDEEELEDVIQLDTVYSLLRRFPQALMS